MSETSLRAHYEKLFAPYPDVVDLPTLREMMGGISETFARRLLRQKIVKSFKAPAAHHEAYFIPKVCVLDYVVSDAYQTYKGKLKYQI